MWPILPVYSKMTTCMKRLLEISFLVIILIYFGSFIVGRPSLEKGKASDSYGLDESESLEISSDSGDRKAPEVKIVLDPGLIRNVYYISKARSVLDDPLLESDSRPENLFRNLERAYILNIFLLIIASAWCILTFLGIYARIGNHWFSRPMTVMIVAPSTFALLLIISIVRKDQILNIGFHPLAILMLVFESLLLGIGMWMLYGLSFPQLPSEKNALRLDFMDHMRKSRTSLRSVLSSGVRIFSHIVVIGVTALVISNVFLLPLYTMQTGFPGLFSALLVIGLLILSAFYVTAYFRVSKNQGGSGDPLTSVSFLGFRFISNGLFLTGIAALVVLILGVVVITALVNTGVLQAFSLLPTPEGL